VYEVVASIGGRFYEMEAHLRRLERSSRAIGLPLPHSLKELAHLIRVAVAKNDIDRAMVYIQVTRGRAPRAHGFPVRPEPSIIITVRPLPHPREEALEKGLHVVTLPDIRWRRCDIKCTALLANVLGKQEAHARDADEAFWLDEDGHVLEGCSTNAFGIVSGRLVTHPSDHRILDGITRRKVIALAEKVGIAVDIRPWRLDEDGFEECLLSSTTNAVLPVTRIDGKPVGSGRPGKTAEVLRRLLLADMQQNLRP